MAFLTYWKAASPAAAEILPISSVSGFTRPISYTLMPPRRNRASSTRRTGRISAFPVRPHHSSAFSIIPESPITSGRQISSTGCSASALAVISGPLPEGSPIVMARMGFSIKNLLSIRSSGSLPPAIIGKDRPKRPRLAGIHCGAPRSKRCYALRHRGCRAFSRWS